MLIQLRIDIIETPNQIYLFSFYVLLFTKKAKEKEQA